jgi:hypothetical protein
MLLTMMILYTTYIAFYIRIKKDNFEIPLYKNSLNEKPIVIVFNIIIECWFWIAPLFLLIK